MSGEPRAPPLDARPEDLEVLIPKILRAGLVVSAALITAGLVLDGLLRPSTGGAPFSLFNLPALLAAADPRGVIGLGILVLLSTPLVRVVASFGYFLRERDRLYVLLTAIVLANLALAAAVGAV